MAQNIITYTVEKDEITPKTKQYGGVQGDHNETTVRFVISDMFWNEIQSKVTSGESIPYGFQICNGAGEEITVDGGKLEYQIITIDVDEFITRYGGVAEITLFLVFGSADKDKFTYPAKLKFKGRVAGARGVEEHKNVLSIKDEVAEMRDETAENKEVAANAAAYVSQTASDVSRMKYEVETKLANGDYKGEKGDKGDKGDSVTVERVVQNNASGGKSYVVFSDGKSVSIRNGLDGENGNDGTSVTVKNVTESEESGGENIVTFSDGKQLTVRNGKDGSGGGGGSGENGATFIPSVSKEGIISWTNDKGLSNPTPVNIKGIKGDDYTLTEADKEDIAHQTLNVINPPFEVVNNVAEMTDTSKAYVLSTNGNIYAYANVTVKHEAENKFIPSEAAINKSMGVSALETNDGFVWSNAIPVDMTKETPFRIKVEGTEITEDTSQKQKLWLCADEGGLQKTSAAIIVYGTTASLHTTLLEDGTIYADYSGGTRLNDSIINQIKTVRIGFKFSDTAITSTDELNGVKITFPSENYEETISTWVNTGIKPSANGGGVNYVDLVVKLAEIQAMLSVASRGISDD